MAFYPDHAGVAAGALDGIALDVGVILFIDPAARAQRRRADELQQRIGDVHLWNVVRLERLARLGLGPGPVIFGRGVAEILDRQIGHDLALPFDAEAEVAGGDPDGGEIQLPLLEHGARLRLLGRLQHHEHALLAFAEHHLIGRHIGFADRHLVEIEHDAEIALGAHFDRRAGEPGRAHVLDGDHRAGRHQFEAGFEQALFGEGVADLDGRALLLDVVAEFGRSHGGAADAVAAGLGTEIDHRQADAFGLGVENLAGVGEAGGKGVDEDVSIVAFVELDFAAHGRHAEAIAIAADAGDDARHQMAGLFMVR